MHQEIVQGRTISKAFIADSIVVACLSVLTNAFNYFFIMWAGRSLPSASFGLLATFLALLTLLTVVANSISLRVNQMLAGGSAAAIWHYTKRLSSRMLMVLLCVGIVLVLLNQVVRSQLKAETADLAALTIATVGLFLFSVANGCLSALHALRLQYASSMLSSGLRLVGAMLLGGYTASVCVWLLVYGLHYWCIVLVAAGYLSFQVRTEPATLHLKPLPKVPASLWNLATYLLAVIPFVADQVYVQLWHTPLSGSYGALANLGRIPFYACSPIFGVMLPYLLRAVRRGEPVRQLGAIACVMVLLVAAGASVSLSLFPEPIRRLCFGDRYQDIAGLLPLFAWTMALYSINYALVLLLFVWERRATIGALMLPVLLQVLCFANAPSGLETFLAFQMYVVTLQSAALACYGAWLLAVHRNANKRGAANAAK